MKILVVEDEKDLNRIIAKLLQKKDYVVDSAYDGIEALHYIKTSSYDAIIMDVMMPKLDGYKTVDQIRLSQNNTPIIMLTARDSLSDKINGLNLGADDYLVKPFEFDELLARLNALIRRKYGNATTKLTTQDLIVDTSNKTVMRNNVAINLTAKEYKVLEYLLQNKNRIVSREQIRQSVWDYDNEAESNVIDVLIKNIRKKIDINNSNTIIHTKRGLGYVIKETN
ncbi:response regulator transcription factor [Actinomyces sp. zg-332]|uniref:response regulator transcription factor n=1 Tax=Actinomyces sp. zg-332 TaxID=2708340 RepID=UPI0014205B7F|nr:response regulator transcription factor [Actinomyces sp. zg-332]QPK93686.1 response regulator transcription factor [Actinomyces sp. zg-332]